MRSIRWFCRSSETNIREIIETPRSSAWPLGAVWKGLGAVRKALGATWRRFDLQGELPELSGEQLELGMGMRELDSGKGGCSEALELAPTGPRHYH
jgi:hypothetical protein